MIDPVLLYTLEVSICTALFYAVYFFALRKLTFFHWNRCYLLLSLTASILIPLLHLPGFFGEKDIAITFMSSWEIYEKGNASRVPASWSFFNWADITFYIYLLGVSVLLFKFLISLSLIIPAYRQKSFTHFGRIRIVRGRRRITNCSFLDTIFIDHAPWTPEEYDQILAHERCHILLGHTYDKLYLNILQILLWYNPLIYLYKRSLEEVHEFEADALLVKGTDRIKYAGLLLRFATNPPTPLVHPFSKRPLKSRIQMLFTDKSAPFKKVAYLMGVPVLALVLLSFGIKNKDHSLVNPFPSFMQDKKEITDHSRKEKETYSKQGSNENDRLRRSMGTSSQASPLDSAAIKNSELNFLESVFFNRRTLLTPEGIAYDEIRMNIGSSHIVGHITKGGKMKYQIKGKEYKEEEIKKFTPKEIQQINCPCKVRIIDAKIDTRIDGIYEGIIQIGIF